MTSSPGPSGSTLRRRGWPTIVAWTVVVVGAAGAAGGAVVPFAASAEAPSAAAGRAASVETRVAGISVERPSVDAAALVARSTTTGPPAAPAADPAPASAPTPTPTDTAAPTTLPPAPTAATVRAQVLAAITFPWQERLPGWRIEFLPERKGYRGSTFPDDRLIQIYLREGLTLADYVHVAAHELGHAVDVTLLDDTDHERWNTARGRDADAGWWVDSGADDFASGAGDWAESFAWSQLPSGRFYSELGPPPNAEQLAVLRDIVG